MRQHLSARASLIPLVASLAVAVSLVARPLVASGIGDFAVYLPLVLTSCGTAVPPPSPGWTAVWSDDFSGSAGSSPSSANWLFDLGTAYLGGPPNWGTGEVETDTSAAANVQQDGN